MSEELFKVGDVIKLKKLKTGIETPCVHGLVVGVISDLDNMYEIFYFDLITTRTMYCDCIDQYCELI